jgi:hypothetical protein
MPENKVQTQQGSNFKGTRTSMAHTVQPLDAKAGQAIAGLKGTTTARAVPCRHE